ncbi:hypothetical protein BHC49_04370 [Snodgrassella alvi]|uniref:Uncharacterized protein n=1 Tax=Snodgrassella alvi TaxID=1196083 RepID=A0A2N9XZD7_9NEIS|nr:hypothetical protein BHC49_04370 [Snodgrassella alvi]
MANLAKAIRTHSVPKLSLAISIKNKPLKLNTFIHTGNNHTKIGIYSGKIGIRKIFVLCLADLVN